MNSPLFRGWNIYVAKSAQFLKSIFTSNILGIFELELV